MRRRWLQIIVAKPCGKRAHRHGNDLDLGAIAWHAREYRARMPRDRSKVQIVPVPVRPFPARLRDDDLQPSSPHPSERAALAWGIVLLVGIPGLIAKAWKYLRASR